DPLTQVVHVVGYGQRTDHAAVHEVGEIRANVTVGVGAANRVARNACRVLEELTALGGLGGGRFGFVGRFGLVIEPRLEVLGGVGDDLHRHQRVLETTELRA